MDGQFNMGTLDRGYEPKFKRLHKDKRRNKREFVHPKYRSKYDRRYKK